MSRAGTKRDLGGVERSDRARESWRQVACGPSGAPGGSREAHGGAYSAWTAPTVVREGLSGVEYLNNAVRAIVRQEVEEDIGTHLRCS